MLHFSLFYMKLLQAIKDLHNFARHKTIKTYKKQLKWKDKTLSQLMANLVSW